MKILLCDIDKSYGEMFRTNLSWFDMEVDFCLSPEDILRSFKSTQYDLFICANWLGSLDGFTLAGTIRHMEHGHPKDLGILILTYEVPNFEEMKFLYEKRVSFMYKFSSPKIIAEKIEVIRSHRSGAGKS